MCNSSIQNLSDRCLQSNILSTRSRNFDQTHFQTIPLQEKILTQSSGYDLISDQSFERFLDNNHPFKNKNYQPQDLTGINSDFTFNNARKFQLRAKA